MKIDNNIKFAGSANIPEEYYQSRKTFVPVPDVNEEESESINGEKKWWPR